MRSPSAARVPHREHVTGWLAGHRQSALEDHWKANGGYYQSVIPAPGDKAPYDPNSDIVMAAIYGAVAVTVFDSQQN